jgi:hypothetical protein
LIELANWICYEKWLVTNWEKLMNDIERERDGVTWKIAVRVWWAQTWRQIVALTVIQILPGLVVKMLLKDDLVARWIIWTAPLVFIIPITVWAVRRSLQVEYASFSIIIKEKERH